MLQTLLHRALLRHANPPIQPLLASEPPWQPLAHHLCWRVALARSLIRADRCYCELLCQVAGPVIVHRPRPFDPPKLAPTSVCNMRPGGRTCSLSVWLQVAARWMRASLAGRRPGCPCQFQRAGRNKSKIYFLFNCYIHPEDPLAKVIWSFGNIKEKVHVKMH